VENPGIWSLQVLESPGKQYFTVRTNPVFIFMQQSPLPLCVAKKFGNGIPVMKHNAATNQIVLFVKVSK